MGAPSRGGRRVRAVRKVLSAVGRAVEVHRTSYGRLGTPWPWLAGLAVAVAFLLIAIAVTS